MYSTEVPVGEHTGALLAIGPCKEKEPLQRKAGTTLSTNRPAYGVDEDPEPRKHLYAFVTAPRLRVGALD